MRLLVFIYITGLILSCSSVKNSANRKLITPDTPLDIAAVDSFWSLRADTANANRALEALQKLAEMDSNSITLWSKLSRAFYYQAQFLTHNPVSRDSLFMCGYECSKLILNQNNEYRNLLFSSGDEGVAVRGLDEKFIDALYWGMANYGQWLSTKGALVRLGQRDLIWTTLEHINDLDSTYYFGAYYRYRGALLACDPEFQSDTTAIRSAFETAIGIAPDYLGNYTLMAMYYCPLTQDKDLFYQLLTQVITARANSELPYAPENLLEKKQAEQLMIKAEKENWFN